MASLDEFKVKVLALQELEKAKWNDHTFKVTFEGCEGHKYVESLLHAAPQLLQAFLLMAEVVEKVREYPGLIIEQRLNQDMLFVENTYVKEALKALDEYLGKETK